MEKFSRAKETKFKMFELVKECLAYKGKKEEFIKSHGLVRQRYYYWQKRYLEEQNFSQGNFKKIDLLGFEPSLVNEARVKKSVELNFSSGLRITIFE